MSEDRENYSSGTKVKKTVPIHVHISTVFVSLFLLIALITGWYNYGKTSEILMVAAENTVQALSVDIQQQITITYRPVRVTVEVLSRSGITEARTPQERYKYLPMLAEATTMGGQVSAFQVGYSDGDYYIVRNAEEASVREQFNAPDDSYYIVDDIDRNGAEAILQRKFYTRDLQWVGEAKVESTEYDPRLRPWYYLDSDKTQISEPYLFYFLKRIGVTISRPSVDHGAVVAADISLDSISHVLAARQIYPSAELVLASTEGTVVAYDTTSKLIHIDDSDGRRMVKLDELGSPVITEIYRNKFHQNTEIEFYIDEELWLGRSIELPIGAYNLHLIAIFPESELLSEALDIRREVQWVHLLILMVALPLIWFVAHRISVPIRYLARQARAIEQFNFSEPKEISTAIKEIDELAVSMNRMRKTISQYNSMISAMSAEKDFTNLLKLVAKATREISRADIAAVYLLSDDGERLELELAQINDGKDIVEIYSGVDDINLKDPNTELALVESIRNRETTSFIFPIDRASETVQQQAFSRLNNDHIDMACLPLVERNGEVMGVLLLGVGDDSPEHTFSGSWLGFIEQLSSFSALSIENRQLIKMQKELMESFIKLIASAIDAKSPYTGGHCQRVPEITKLLAQAACDDQSGLYKDFDLNADQWEELHFACWLHDCGKVTTPEYVVDKSTKLETIYDRIHEVRMRFEVLKRDAEIDYWKCLYNGGDQGVLKSTFNCTLQQLDDDFKFIADCNEGGEFMAPEKIERLMQLAEKTWTRTLSDRIGISWEEAQRKSRTKEPDLPCQEPLLSNKDEHIIERSERERLDDDNPWGFKMPSPECMYNRGEIYNLSVARGTLSEEERYKINEHMIQTIMMLEKLPYPKHLRNVPIIAGGHHEKMDGTGYPKRLTKDDMPLTARMMAIGDIFEALTAADRPYKKAKTLNEAIRIMSFMRKDNHIDAELFELFLRSGTYLKYAEKFLTEDQIDTVDISQYLSA